MCPEQVQTEMLKWKRNCKEAEKLAKEAVGGGNVLAVLKKREKALDKKEKELNEDFMKANQRQQQLDVAELEMKEKQLMQVQALSNKASESSQLTDATVQLQKVQAEAAQAQDNVGRLRQEASALEAKIRQLNHEASAKQAGPSVNEVSILEIASLREELEAATHEARSYKAQYERVRRESAMSRKDVNPINTSALRQLKEEHRQKLAAVQKQASIDVQKAKAEKDQLAVLLENAREARRYMEQYGQSPEEEQEQELDEDDDTIHFDPDVHSMLAIDSNMRLNPTWKLNKPAHQKFHRRGISGRETALKREAALRWMETSDLTGEEMRRDEFLKREAALTWMSATLSEDSMVRATSRSKSITLDDYRQQTSHNVGSQRNSSGDISMQVDYNAPYAEAGHRREAIARRYSARKYGQE